MNITNSDQNPSINDLPFTVEKKEDHLILSAKPKRKLSRQGRKDFEKNSTKVKVVLFDEDYFDRMSKIKVEFEENSFFAKFFHNLRTKAIDLLLK
jgi:hypothetical protein